MSISHVVSTEGKSAEAKENCIATGKLPEDAQLTTQDTGWTAKEKEQMRRIGYDNVDMIKAWYS